VGTTVRATAKPVTHILTSTTAPPAITPVAWSPAVNFDHAEVVGACSSCHNNVQAQGKGPTHITTDLECNACHSTIGWAGAVFKHTNVVGGCANCHNGMGATGRRRCRRIFRRVLCPSSRPDQCALRGLPLTDELRELVGHCDESPGVTPPCSAANCHEAGKSFFGVTIVTRPATVKGGAPGHGRLRLCHTSTVSFALGNLMPAAHPDLAGLHAVPRQPVDFTQKVMDHTGITSGCATCHAAGLSFFDMAPLVLKTPAANHINFGGAACESCHSNSTLQLARFTFTNASGTAPPRWCIPP